MHCHLVPGVDDGSPDLETSLALIGRMERMGYRRIITTPHVLLDYYPNSPATIRPPFEKLKAALRAQGSTLDLRVAAEYYLDTHLMELVAAEAPLLTLSGQKILLEFSFISPPMQLQELLFQIKVRGYEPIIAHPERYTYFHHDFSQYQKLVDKGYPLQLNLLSFTGHYGKGVQQAARQLLDKGLVSYLGTDLHHHRHAEELGKLLQDQRLWKKLSAYPWQNDSL